MNCDRCEKEIVKPEGNLGTGYGVSSKGEKYCYSCCAELDRESMQKEGRIDLYLQGTMKQIGFRPSEVVNWPGTLRFPVKEWSKGLHFIPNRGYVPRYDVWFRDELGGKWWGVQRGEWNEIVRCRRVK